MTGGDICNHLRYEERTVFWSVSSMKSILAYFFFEAMNTADTDAKNNSDTFFICCLEINTAILHCFHCTDNGILRIKIHLVASLTIDIITSVKILHLASEVSLEQAGIEMCNRTGTTLSRLNIFPSFGS